MTPTPLTRLAPRPAFAMRLTPLALGLFWGPVAALAAIAPAYFAFMHKPVSGGLWVFGFLLASHWLGLLVLLLRHHHAALPNRGSVLSSFLWAAVGLAVVAIGLLAAFGPARAWAIAPLILGLALLQGVLSGGFTAVAAFGETAVESAEG